MSYTTTQTAHQHISILNIRANVLTVPTAILSPNKFLAPGAQSLHIQSLCNLNELRGKLDVHPFYFMLTVLDSSDMDKGYLHKNDQVLE